MRVTKSLIGFSFASDWLRTWREFSEPITDRTEAKPIIIGLLNLRDLVNIMIIVVKRLVVVNLGEVQLIISIIV